MPLIYALVAQGSTILADHNSGNRDFSQGSYSDNIVKGTPEKSTYVWEQYLFHYISEGGFTYLVVADDSAGRRMPFAFIAELQRKFISKPSSSSLDESMPAYGLQDTFGPVIESLMHAYNTAPRARTELNQVQNIMVQNVEQNLSRGDRVELLVADFLRRHPD